MRWLKGILKVLIALFILVVLIIAVAFWMLSQEKYQNQLVHKATSYLSDKLKTPVDVKHVSLTLFNQFNIEGVYIADEKKDTLAYVGALQLKTSELLSAWWYNETPVIHHLGLNNVYVNLNRGHDSTRWNYDFISEAFSSNSNTDTTTADTIDVATNHAPEAILDLKNLHLDGVRFIMNDAWRGEDMRFAIQTLDLAVNKFQLDKKKIELEHLTIETAKILVREYEGGKPEDNTPDDTTTWGTPFNPELFQVNAHQIKIASSEFDYIVDGFQSKKNEFDEENLRISNLNISLLETHVLADTIYSTIESLTAKERCGIEIKELKAKAKVSQVQSLLYDMTLRTNESFLADRYEMRYKNFHDFNNYLEKVVMNVHLNNSKVSSHDIAYFANVLNEYPISIDISGYAHGTVANLYAQNIALHTSETNFKGNARVTGLPDMDNVLFDIEAKEFRSNGNDLNKLIPQTKTEAVAWSDLKDIRFNGTYNGGITNFHAKGNLLTSLGNAVLDLSMDFKPKIPTYKGQLATTAFDIGRLIKQDKVGKITMDGSIDGRGFELNTLQAKVNAKVSEIFVDQTDYHDLTINGLVANKKFDGIFISQDEKLAVNFNGKLDLSGKQPSYNFASRFVRFNLQKMGITKDPILGSGYVQLNFTGDNIDNFLGSAFLRDITIENNNQKIFLKEVHLNSTEELGEKTISVKSSLADAMLKGKFNISELAPTIQYFLYHYLPHYINKPEKAATQSFTFTAQLKNIDTLVQTLIPKLKGLSNSYVDAYLNTTDQKLGLDINIPVFGYDQFYMKQISIVSAGDLKGLDITATGGNLFYNEELMIPAIQLTSSMANDTANLAVNTQSINDLLGDASINCKATALNDQLFVHMLPSNVRIKEDNWQFYSEEDMVFGKHIRIKGFNIENGAQKIALNTRDGLLQESTEDLLDIAIQEIDLENISNYLGLDNPRFFGRFSGNINVQDFMNHPFISAEIHSTQALKIDQDILGMVNANISYDVDKQILEIKNPSSLTHDNSSGFISGKINQHDSTINVQAELNKTSIALLNQFLSDYVSNLNGFATGTIMLKGDLNKPTITSSLKLEDATCKVLFLGTTYTIPSINLSVNNKVIKIDPFQLKDERLGEYYGNVKGSITHNDFSDFDLNFKVNSDNLLCLNTGEFDNSLFYGYVPGALTVNVTGPLDDIDLDMKIKPLKGSVFNLPINSSGDASSYDYIQFAEFGHAQDEQTKKKKSSNYVKMNIDIDATPDALVNIILDQNTQEQIVARGNGNLNLNIDLGNTMTMTGAYVISEGKYNFNFRGVLPRIFDISDGSKVTWSGDPLDAKVDISAIFQAQKPLALYNLINQSTQPLEGTDLAEAKKTYKTFVPITLSGSLGAPEIKFDITQPDNKAVGTPGYIALENLRKNENELFSQAGVILLLGDFKAPEGGIATSTYGQGAISTVSDVVTNYVSSEITNQFQNLTGIKNLIFNVNYQNKSDAYAQNPYNVNQVSVNVSGAFFKQRVIVDFENSVDFARGSSGNSNNNYAGNFKAQFLITEDGRLRLNTYRISDQNLDGTSNTGITKSGLGVSYRQVFNRFGDLIQSKKRKPGLLNDSTKSEVDKLSGVSN